MTRNVVRILIPDYSKPKAKKIKYVLDMLSLFLGVKFEVVDQDADIVCSPPDFSSWRSNQIRVTYINDTPVLYTNTRPDFLIRDGRLGFDLLAAVFWLLSRQEEVENNYRDKWNNFRFSYSVLNRLGLLYKPIINFWVSAIGNYIDRLNVGRLPLWKNGKKFAVALTHDVDLVSLGSVKEKYRACKLAFDDGLNYKTRLEILATLPAVLLKRLVSPAPINPCWQFEKWLRLEENHGFKSTFFFFADEIRRRHHVDAFYRHDDEIVFDRKRIRVKDMIREIASAGWEIGLHAGYNSSQDLDGLCAEKQQLEKVLQQDVNSVRQHFLRFDVNVTPIIHAQANLKSDSTLGFNRNIGFRAGVAYPFKPWNFHEELEIATWEVPLTIQDGALFKADFLNMTDLELSLHACTSLIEEVENTGGLITLLWHPHVIADKTYPNWFRVYQSLLEYLAEKDCWVTSVGEITSWWMERRNNLLC